MTQNPPQGGLASVSAQVRNSGDARCRQQAPTVRKVSPANGPLAGGTRVTITGSGFTGATAVSFGSTPASAFLVNSPTSITATSPAGTSRGPVDVTVTTQAGTSAASRQFTYTLSLNILTWNSTGETPAGAAALQGVINSLILQQWQPHVIVIQEANQNQNPPGPIYQTLQNLGNDYNQPPSHIAEGPGQSGRAYLLLTHDSVQMQPRTTFSQLDLTKDQVLKENLKTLSPGQQQAAERELLTMRMPAVAHLIFNDAQVAFLTWHAPLGPAQVFPGYTLPGGGNLDAFWFLQASGSYNSLFAPGIGNISVIAADLNIQFVKKKTPSWILNGWVGQSNNLDHILGHLQPGQGNPGFSHGGNYSATGTHPILVGTASW